MIPQWVLEGKEDIKWEKVSPTTGQATSHLHRHSPTEPFEPTSSPFSPYTLEMTSSEIYTLLVQETVYYGPWSICRKRDRRSNETIYGWNPYYHISILKHNLESSPELKSILTEFGITWDPGYGVSHCVLWYVNQKTAWKSPRHIKQFLFVCLFFGLSLKCLLISIYCASLTAWSGPQ